MNDTPQSGGQWERQVLEKLASSALDEQRRARRWGVFFKLLTFAYLFFLLFLLKADWLAELGETTTGEKHTALVEVEGVIAADSEARADHVISGLREAFEDKNTAAVIVRINSPGGSPVQAGYINDEIRRLREKHKDIPVYAVITDLCASGGYYIAAAADKIYVDKASIVGSIGVIMNGFGFVGTMEKLGVERRLLTAGEHKALLDPFSPQKSDESAHLQAMLDQIHQQFIEVVKKGRGEKLKDDPKLFSGLVWSGEEAIKLGLADEFGSSSYVAREVVKAETIVNYTPKKDYLERFAKRFGAAMAESLAGYLNLNAGALR